MSIHRYPAEAQRSDLIRGGIGLLLTVGPLAVLPMHWVVSILFGAAALLFALFTARIIQRTLTRYESGEQGIAAHGPLGATIAWDELSALKLHFFSTRRDRGNGWMLLVLKGGNRSLKLESTLTALQSRRIARAYAEAGTERAREFRTVLRSIVNQEDRGRIAPLDLDAI